MDFPSHVAIVGCGFSGTSALFQLVDRHPVRAVTVFEATGDFGPGYPYRTAECPDYLINNTTDSMCLTPENRRAFLNWLEARADAGIAADLDPKGHLPRSVFGAFLKDTVETAKTMAAVKGIALTFVPAEVTAIREPSEGGVLLRWDGGSLKADAALLTTGRCPDLDLYPVPPADGARYIASHISTDALDAVPMEATVHILGASLSAYDVLNRLFSADTGCRFERAPTGNLLYNAGPNGRRAVLISRSGRLKKMESRRPGHLKRSHFTLPALRSAASGAGLSLAAAAQAIDRDAGGNGVRLDRDALLDPYRGCGSLEALNQMAFDGLARDIAAAQEGGAANFLVEFATGAQRDLWAAFAENILSPDEEARYRREVEAAWLTYAAPCPIPTAERLLALHRAGVLSIRRGAGAVTLEEDGAHYRIAHADGEDRADILVNTTGRVDRDVTSGGQPALIRNLCADGLLKPYERAGSVREGAAVDMKTYRAEGSRNIYLANMLLWGPGYFTSSAFLMASAVKGALQAMGSTPAGEKQAAA